MLLHLLSMEHGRNAAKNNFFTALTEFTGNLKRPWQLGGQHGRNRHQITVDVKINRLQVVIGKGQVDIVR